MEDNRVVIERLVTEFGRCADRCDGAGLSLLFLEHGTLNANGKVADGREAIAKLTNDRCADPTHKTRHLWSNLLIESQDNDCLTSSFIQITFEQKGTDRPAQARVSDVVDVLRRDAQGNWRFASRTITRQMTI